MPTFEVKALKGHDYRGIRRNPGEPYEIDGRSHLRLYKALGWVAEAPQELSPPAPPVVEPSPAPEPAPVEFPAAPTYATRDLVPALTAEDAAAAEKPKRQYRRRDMTAEEG